MKKCIPFILALILMFPLSACGSSGTATGDEAQQMVEAMMKDVTNTVSDMLPADVAADMAGDISAGIADDVPGSEASEIKEPVMNWFMIDDFETGIPRLVMEFTNPNSTAIDFTVDVTFLKGGESQGVAEDLYKSCIPAGEKCIIWYNWEIPQADGLGLNFTYLAASMYTPVNCSYRETAKDDASVTMEFSPQGTFGQCFVDVIGTLNGSRTSHLTYDFYDLDSAEFCFEGWRAFDSYEVYINCF